MWRQTFRSGQQISVACRSWSMSKAVICQFMTYFQFTKNRHRWGFDIFKHHRIFVVALLLERNPYRNESEIVDRLKWIRFRLHVAQFILLKASAKCTTDDTRCEQCFCFVFHYCCWSFRFHVQFVYTIWMIKLVYRNNFNTFNWLIVVVFVVIILSSDSSIRRFICFEMWRAFKLMNKFHWICMIQGQQSRYDAPCTPQSWKWNVQMKFSFSLNTKQASERVCVIQAFITNMRCVHNINH